jgi:predicted phosphodiesterase
MINGHTHVPMVEAFRGLVIINAGTVVNDQNPVCLLVDFSALNVHFFDMSCKTRNEKIVKIYG